MNETQLAGLRRQLGALAYDAAALTPAAAPLVAALLADLVRATDSYQEVKGRAGDAGAAAQSAGYQVGSRRGTRVLPAGPARLVGGRALHRRAGTHQVNTSAYPPHTTGGGAAP